MFADLGYWDVNDTSENANDDFWVEGDHHLKSEVGRWDPLSESWVVDAVTSPCIDSGDPNSPLGDQPRPNGGQINMVANMRVNRYVQENNVGLNLGVS